MVPGQDPKKRGTCGADLALVARPLSAATSTLWVGSSSDKQFTLLVVRTASG